MLENIDRKNLLSIGFFLVLAGFYVFSTLTTEEPNPDNPLKEQITEENLKQGFVELFVGGTPLYVPLEFLSENLFGVNNEVGTLILYFSYPELEPVVEDTGPVFLDIQRKKENYIGDERTLREVWKVDPEGKPGPYGLTFHPVREGYEHLVPGLKVYSYDFENGNTLFLTCLDKVCATRFYRGFEEVDIYYRFFERNLSDWRRIYDHLTGLVKGFLSGEFVDHP